ncbi:MAG: hypothetical protein KKF85_08925 [Gammaproteobacteria bacterium]|nr:hypothetical protein [Rhodocyclaceae bacterium]MBU3910664.1 hypothetical protein [Gammaproteobacteria bacterium]MBU3989907.1 hypothetical protein [Gammaproteobacteria bacterium]MBU4005126.1 hypothetical protein [Gammaproteobacteria bacterium]MBU4021018.1 hypothetical protein [Gammaproteobacteria bacterium]
MAIPWLAVLKVVPWKEVISNAPAVADGAKKLWSTVGRKPAGQAAAFEKTEVQPPSDNEVIATLQARLAAVETAAADLHSQMLASSELIKTLAEQNTQLIKRVEANRLRVVWLGATTVVVGIIAILGVFLAAAR